MGRGKSRKSLELIEAAREILAEIQPATVRAVCYRLFVAGGIDSMAKKNTSRVSVQLTYAREQGIIPWDWIVDETRRVESWTQWEDPEAFAADVSRKYRRDNWALQDTIVQVWSEKGTVRGTLEPILSTYGVDFCVLHGFASSTAAYNIARRIENDDRRFVALYVGDWDCSGLYMSEHDLPERLRQYGASPDFFFRVALTEEDISDSDLPSFPAIDKKDDPRYRWFISRYGTRCWELDALSPAILRNRVARYIEAQIDKPTWNRCLVAERAETESLKTFLDQWARTREGRL